MIPGDPARVILGERATPGELARIREELGLNKPILIQYLIFLKQLIKGDLGRSIVTREKVINEIMIRFPATIELTLFSMFIASFLGIFFGILASLKPGSIVDTFVMFLALVGVSMPYFLVRSYVNMVWGSLFRVVPSFRKIRCRYKLECYNKLLLD